MRLRKIFAAVAVFVAASVAGISPASAELGNANTLDWGVTGLATGTSTDSINTSVWAIEQVGNRVFVGGRFTQVTNGANAFDQPYLAAFDALSGNWISSWTPQLDGAVYALEASPDGTRLFVGGDFDTVNGGGRDALVAIDPITGVVDLGWSADVNGSPVVRSLDIQDNWLYVGGGFTSVISSTGNNAAFRALRFDVNTGGHDAGWRPVVTGGSVWGIAASPDMDRVYLAGNFAATNGATSVGGFQSLSSIDGTNSTGVQPLAVNTTNSNRNYLYDVEVVNGRVYAAGSEHFVQVLTESDLSLEIFHLAEPRGDYQDLEVVGDRVYASCHCRADAILESSFDVLWFSNPPPGVVDGVPFATAPTTWVVAFDAATGLHVPSFLPDATSAAAGIWAVHGDTSGCLWLGGDITTAGGQSADNLIRLCEAGAVDNERPSVPGAPQVQEITLDGAVLTWNPSTDNVGVTRYELFNASDNSVLAESPTNGITLTGLAPGDYSLYVRAYDAFSNQSFRSGTRTFTVTGAVSDTQRPSTPGSPVATDVGTDFVTVAMNPSTDNVGVAGYRIFNSADNTEVAEFATNTGTISGLAPGVYQWYARSFDAAGNISFRSGNRTVEVTGGGPVDTERPSPPGSPMVTALGDDFVDLSWNAASDNVGVDSYRIIDNSNAAVLLDTSATSGTLTGLAPGTYEVYGRAVDAAGNVSYRSGIRTFTVTGGGPAPDTVRPSTPGAAMVLAVTDTTAALQWNPSTDNVAVAGYRVFDNSDGSVLLETTDPNGTLTGLTPATDYQIYVRAFDAAGNVSYRSGFRNLTTTP